jgi:hypothetical protein
MRLISSSLTLAFCITLANANPILDDVSQYEVIFTAKYKKSNLGGAKYLIQTQIRGDISKSIEDRINISARLPMNDNQMVLFKFWKNGSKEFGMETIDKKDRIRSWIDGKYHYLNVKDLVDKFAQKKKADSKRK